MEKKKLQKVNNNKNYEKKKKWIYYWT
jgi:hypothetical protein